MTAQIKFPRFFVTDPSPCPYLPNKEERKVFTELNGVHAEELNDALSRIGFRRSQNVAYRPSCIGCQACISVRVLAGEFTPSATQKRIIRRNSDLQVSICRPWATGEQFQLLRKYLARRHPTGGMTEMDELDFSDMVEHSPIKSNMVEYREATEDGSKGRLIGACLTDRQADGLSMIYSFFDPDHGERKGIGNYIIMDHIIRARTLGLSYAYLGYWVKGSPQMAYKVKFRPLERLGPNGWERFDMSSNEVKSVLDAVKASKAKNGKDDKAKDGKDNMLSCPDKMTK